MKIIATFSNEDTTPNISRVSKKSGLKNKLSIRTGKGAQSADPPPARLVASE
jgi:hypothetical protein